jgi:chorismate synthase
MKVKKMTFSFGKKFRIHVFGESHGELVGVTVEGCTPGLEIDASLIQADLDKRKPGTGNIVSSRSESDIVSIHSGVFHGRATGAPITMTVPNLDVDSSPYEETKSRPRPGHADYTSGIKYAGFNDHRGGGIFSGRMTAAFVMAGSIAKVILQGVGIEVLAHVIQIGKVKVARDMTNEEIRSNVYTNPVCCAAPEAVKILQSEIELASHEGDSVGGLVECRVLGVPVGYGEPLFDSVESLIAHAMFSIPGVKGVEFGSGFRGASKRGSENNDTPILRDGKVTWSKNDAGGILGGITNGAPIVFQVAIKPTPSISKQQETVDLERLEQSRLTVKGRHDPCIAIRAVSAVEGLTAVAIADFALRGR